MDDLVRWLGEQLAEDERIARAATPGPWRQHDIHLGQYGHTATVLSGEGNSTDLRAWLPSMSQESWDKSRNVWNDAVHIAEHDPARVLREIDAKRQLVKLHRRYVDEPGQACLGCAGGIDWEACPVVRLLTLPYADRPGHRDEWRP